MMVIYKQVKLQLFQSSTNNLYSYMVSSILSNYMVLSNE